MREILLMRHGKAVAYAADRDAARPLKDRGKRAAQRVGAWLATARLVPDCILASPAERSKTTAEKCCKAMGLDARIVRIEPRLYAADEGDVLDTLNANLADHARVLLVGHNPSLARVLARLTGSDVGRFPTGALAHLVLPEGGDQSVTGHAVLQSFVEPGELPQDFPYPAPDGPERRPRPAYYYTQSAVIPYRMTADRLEVLIVRSSQKKHWVVPKGIADPGHTLQDSAAREAWEEAGVEGEVDDEPIGTYSYRKWGADCKVTVYAMRVSRVLDASDWEERHRGREWVSASVASMLVRQPELADMIGQLAARPEHGIS
jgi:phosphohistidine phosphatase